MAEPAPKPAYLSAATRDWPAYFDAVAGKPARETLLQALDLMVPASNHAPATPPLAHDLGCGEGRDTAELLRRGFHVIATDSHPDAFVRLRARDDLRDPGLLARLTIRLAPLEAVELEPCHLVNASFSLPFCAPHAFPALWDRVVAAIRPGGLFAGQLFGDRDDWARLPDRAHLTRDNALALFAGFDLIRFDEVENDSNDAMANPKHWHVFHVVARKHAGARP